MCIGEGRDSSDTVVEPLELEEGGYSCVIVFVVYCLEYFLLGMPLPETWGDGARARERLATA